MSIVGIVVVVVVVVLVVVVLVVVVVEVVDTGAEVVVGAAVSPVELQAPNASVAAPRASRVHRSRIAAKNLTACVDRR